MAEQNINLSDYNASGVYFLEIDNSILTTTSTISALRLAVGFNMRGPFNRPVYVDGDRTFSALFGGIDHKLERRGCFTNRNIRSMLRKSPVFALNLLSVDMSESEDTNRDKVGVSLMSLDPTRSTGDISGKYPYINMYDRSKFWIADDKTFVNKTFAPLSKTVDASIGSIEESALFGVSNCGTKDISVIIRKAENISGYNITFLDYYGSQDAIPYKWINPNDFISDYFVQVIAISGNWSKDKYAALQSDVFWGKYFNANGLKKEYLNKFLRLDQVGKLGDWTGCILPNFRDKQGVNKSIDFMINKYSNETGLMFGENIDAYEYIAVDGSTYFYDEDGSGKYTPGTSKKAKFAPDFVGNLITKNTGNFGYMSALLDASAGVKEYAQKSMSTLKDTEFAVDASVGGADIAISDYVRAKNGNMTRIIKKRGIQDENGNIYYIFTAYDAIKKTPVNTKVEIHKSFAEMYDTLEIFALDGLKICNRHMPGFDKDGNMDEEAGVKKIYGMLEDDGIRKGLLNNDMIDFRYVIDTMAYGLGENCGGKVYLADLARDKKHCTAFINSPSMTQFAASDEPFFGDTNDGETRSIFKVKYIPEGGNQDLVYSANTESFTLPDVEHGADHIAVFAPFMKYGDGSRTILVPPAADVSNSFMNKFMGGNPYATVANLNGIIVSPDATGVEMMFDDDERGLLEKFGINPIIYRNGNIMIYGDRTAFQDYDSDLNFIHVREILNTIQISCKAILDEYVYTVNTPLTRAEIVSRLNPILSAMKDSDALAKYEIQCDDDNNTKNIIDNKFCIVNIGVWINQNMEKIVVPITINRSTTA